jgi:hypothetical protein
LQAEAEPAGTGSAEMQSMAALTEYARGSWGPAAAARITSRHGGWHDPVIEQEAPC